MRNSTIALSALVLTALSFAYPMQPAGASTTLASQARDVIDVDSDARQPAVTVDTLRDPRSGKLLRQRFYRVGDMLFAAGPQGRAATRANVNLWAGGVVYFQFSNNVTSSQRTRFRRAVAEWETTGLDFRETPGPGGFILVVNHTASNLAVVGMLGGGRPQRLSVSNWNSHGIILHEIGHAIGLVHEHQRSDRDRFVEINGSAIATGGASQFSRQGTRNLTSYDFHSIMHYPSWAFLKPGYDYTIRPKPPFTSLQNVMGRGNSLSQLDRQGVRALYGLTGPQSLPTRPSSSGAGSGKGKRLLIGTQKRDRIVGTNRREEIRGRGGNDIIDARGGNDVIKPGPGRDRIRTGDGKDRIYYTRPSHGGDRILDFIRRKDRLYFRRSMFALAGARKGRMDSRYILKSFSGRATTKDQRFVIDMRRGLLFHDRNGSDFGGRRVIARFPRNRLPDVRDFYVW